MQVLCQQGRDSMRKGRTTGFAGIPDYSNPCPIGHGFEQSFVKDLVAPRVDGPARNPRRGGIGECIWLSAPSANLSRRGGCPSAGGQPRCFDKVRDKVRDKGMEPRWPAHSLRKSWTSPFSVPIPGVPLRHTLRHSHFGALRDGWGVNSAGRGGLWHGAGRIGGFRRGGSIQFR